MTKKISFKTHNKNHNEIHIHIGDKKKKATRRKRTARPRAPPPVPFQQSFQPVPIHTNKPQFLDTVTQVQKERVLQAGFNNPVHVPNVFHNPHPVNAPLFSKPNPVNTPMKFTTPHPTTPVPSVANKIMEFNKNKTPYKLPDYLSSIKPPNFSSSFLHSKGYLSHSPLNAPTSLHDQSSESTSIHDILNNDNLPTDHGSYSKSTTSTPMSSTPTHSDIYKSSNDSIFHDQNPINSGENLNSQEVVQGNSFKVKRTPAEVIASLTPQQILKRNQKNAGNKVYNAKIQSDRLEAVAIAKENNLPIPLSRSNRGATSSTAEVDGGAKKKGRPVGSKNFSNPVVLKSTPYQIRSVLP